MQKHQNDKEIADFLKGYKHISEMADEAMFIHSTKGAIFDVNKTAEEITGYSKKELLGMNVRQLHPESELEISEKALALIENSKIGVDFESQFKKKSGEIIDVRIIGDKFMFKSKSFVIGLVKDITPDRKFAKRKAEIDVVHNKKFLKVLTPLGKIYCEPMQVLIEVAESRDPYTMAHSEKVTNYATRLANAVGLSEKEVETIRLAAMFHDIGKIGIKAQILTKTVHLTQEEYEEIKRHSALSVEIIKSIRPMKGLLPIIRHHHENYDGTGYPDGLKGGKIPLGARILAICDVYDALTSERAYRKAYSYEETLRIMKDAGGKKFDPIFLKCFLGLLVQEKRDKK